jgi:hypothetical protein
MSENTFFKVSRDITRHPEYLSSSHTYRSILITILDYLNFEKQIVDDHGIKITLEPGQLMATDRQIAFWAGCRHDEVQRCLARFTKVQILRQEVRHTKRIITLSELYICKQNKKSSAPKIAPGLRQDCARNKETKKQINKRQEQQQPYIPSSSSIVPFPSVVAAVAVSAFYECLKNIPSEILTDENKQSLMRFPEDRIKKALEWSAENPPKKTLIASLVWHCQREVPPEPKGKNREINLKLCKNYFKTHLSNIEGVHFHPMKDRTIFVVGASEDSKTEIYLNENPIVFMQQLLGAMRKHELPVYEEDLVFN